MKRKRLIVIAAASAVALAATAGIAVAMRQVPQIGMGAASGIVAEMAHFRGQGHGGHMGRRGGHGMGMICGEYRDERLDRMINFVESFVDLDAGQQDAWTRLTDTLRAQSATIGETCEEIEAAGVPDTAPEKLARMETMMAAGLSAMRDVRPAFEAFYQTLNEEQQKALDELTEHRRRH